MDIFIESLQSQIICQFLVTNFVKTCQKIIINIMDIQNPEGMDQAGKYK